MVCRSGWFMVCLGVAFAILWDLRINHFLKCRGKWANTAHCHICHTLHTLRFLSLTGLLSDWKQTIILKWLTPSLILDHLILIVFQIFYRIIIFSCLLKNLIWSLHQITFWVVVLRSGTADAIVVFRVLILLLVKYWLTDNFILMC